mgnify:CR=1 FL=1
MEKKIVLSEEEKNVIEKQLRGELNPFFMEERERELIDKVIDDADALMRELDAYDESGDNLVEWYYNKYKQQG